MANKWMKRSVFLGALIIVVYLYYAYGLSEYLTLDNLKSHQHELAEYYKQNSISVCNNIIIDEEFEF